MIEDICLFPLPALKESLLAVFNLCLDESGKLAKSDYTCLCGYVAHQLTWSRFNSEWDRHRLRWGIPPIHMSRIYAPETSDKNDGWTAIRKQWGSDWEDKRTVMMREFAGVIERSGLVGVGIVVDAAYFRTIPDLHLRKNTHTSDPNVFAFQDALMTTLEKVQVVDQYSPIGLIIDDGEDSAFAYYDLLKNLKQHPDGGMFQKMKERFHAISFVNDASFPGVQAADLFAYTARRFMIDRMGKPPELLTDPEDVFVKITSYGMHQPKLWDKSKLETLAQGNLRTHEERKREIAEAELRRDDEEDSIGDAGGVETPGD
jgi:hypothetical protein